MAKSKYAPALFEVINRQKNTGTLGVPKWWKGGPGPQPDAAAPEPGAPAAAASPTAEPKPAAQDLRIAAEPVMPPPVAQMPPARPRLFTPTTVEETNQAAEHGEAPIAGRLPGVRVDSRRLHLVMTPTHAAVACGAVLVVMVVFFLVGRNTAGKTPAAGDASMTNLLGTGPAAPGAVHEPAGNKTQTPPAKATAGVANGVRAEATGMPKPPAADKDELKVGYHYVLLDKYTRDHLKSAQHVQEWLASNHQIQTVLRERRDSYWLIGKAGFDFSVPGELEKCDQYVERIKALGKDCRKELIHAKLDVYGFASPMKFKLEK